MTNETLTIPELAQIAREAALKIADHPDATKWLENNWSDINALSDVADGFCDFDGKAPAQS
jgi:hypothetical protein